MTTPTELELRMAALQYLIATADSIPTDTVPLAQRLLKAVKDSQRKEEECQQNPKPKP